MKRELSNGSRIVRKVGTPIHQQRALSSLNVYSTLKTLVTFIPLGSEKPIHHHQDHPHLHQDPHSATISKKDILNLLKNITKCSIKFN